MCTYVYVVYMCTHWNENSIDDGCYFFLHRRLTMIYIMIYTIYMRRCSYDEGKGVC